MLSTKKTDWEAAEAMQDKETMFLLYAVSAGTCRDISDFSTHFEGLTEEKVRALITAGFLTESNGRLDVTERGRFVLGDLTGGITRRERGTSFRESQRPST